jgi:hypothetical protein
VTPLLPRFYEAQLHLIHTCPMFEGGLSLENIGYSYDDVESAHITFHSDKGFAVHNRMEVVAQLQTDQMDSSTGCSCPEDDEYVSDQCLEGEADAAESGPLSPIDKSRAHCHLRVYSGCSISLILSPLP